jgi:hypothetical protein
MFSSIGGDRFGSGVPGFGREAIFQIKAKDLGDIVATWPSGRVTSQLNWAALSDENFELLMFSLI